MKDKIRLVIGLLILAISLIGKKIHKFCKKVGYRNIAVLSLQLGVVVSVGVLFWFFVGCFLCVITA